MYNFSAFVHVVESPSSFDLLDGKTEGRLLVESLRLSETPHCYSLAVDRDTLFAALTDRLMQAAHYWNKPPVLHLSMHGDHNGVGLTNKDYIQWDELRGIINPLIQAMKGHLVICMSSCFGAAGCRMAMNANPELPFGVLVGHKGSPTWADAAIAYTSFYHLLFKGFPIEVCVNSMKAACGDHDFMAIGGWHAKNAWTDEMRQSSQQLMDSINQATTEIQHKRSI